MKGFKIVGISLLGDSFRLVSRYFHCDPLRYLLDKAECRKYPHSMKLDKVDIPDENCTCGYYAYEKYEDANKALLDAFSGIICQVSGWGKIAVHDYGFRSSYMDVESIIWPRCSVCGKLKRLSSTDLSFTSSIYLRCQNPEHFVEEWNIYSDWFYQPPAPQSMIILDFKHTYDILKHLADERNAHLQLENN